MVVIAYVHFPFAGRGERGEAPRGGKSSRRVAFVPVMRVPAEGISGQSPNSGLLGLRLFEAIRTLGLQKLPLSREFEVHPAEHVRTVAAIAARVNLISRLRWAK